MLFRDLNSNNSFGFDISASVLKWQVEHNFTLNLYFQIH